MIIVTLQWLLVPWQCTWCYDNMPFWHHNVPLCHINTEVQHHNSKLWYHKPEVWDHITSLCHLNAELWHCDADLCITMLWVGIMIPHCTKSPVWHTLYYVITSYNTSYNSIRKATYKSIIFSSCWMLLLACNSNWLCSCTG